MDLPRDMATKPAKPLKVEIRSLRAMDDEDFQQVDRERYKKCLNRDAPLEVLRVFEGRRAKLRSSMHTLARPNSVLRLQSRAQVEPPPSTCHQMREMQRSIQAMERRLDQVLVEKNERYMLRHAAGMSDNETLNAVEEGSGVFLGAGGMEPLYSKDFKQSRDNPWSRTLSRRDEKVMRRGDKPIWSSDQISDDVLESKINQSDEYWYELWVTDIGRARGSLTGLRRKGEFNHHIRFTKSSLNYFTIPEFGVARNVVLMSYFPMGYQPIVVESNAGAGGDTSTFVYNLNQTPHIFAVETDQKLWSDLIENCNVVTQYWKRDFAVEPMAKLDELPAKLAEIQPESEDKDLYRYYVDVFHVDPKWVDFLGKRDNKALSVEEFVTLVMDEVQTMVDQEVYISVLVVKAPFGREQILSMNEKLAKHAFTLIQTLVFPSLKGQGHEWAFHIFIQAGHVWRWSPSEMCNRNYVKYKQEVRDADGKIVRDLRPPKWTQYTDSPGKFEPYAHQKPETHILSHDDGSLNPAAHQAAVEHATGFFHRARKWATNTFTRGSRADKDKDWRSGT
jgi:hypothetical protein